MAAVKHEGLWAETAREQIQREALEASREEERHLHECWEKALAELDSARAELARLRACADARHLDVIAAAALLGGRDGT